MSWTWKIIKNEIGYQVHKGLEHEGGVLAPNGVGFTMPAFIDYEINTFDTYKKAMSYIRKNSKNDDVIDIDK